MQKLTLLTTIWKRRRYLEEFLARWLAQPEIDEIIVWDNSGEYRPANVDPRVKIINSSYNYGGYIRDVASHFAKNDNVIVADDDILVEPGLVADMLKHYTDNSLVGIWGRCFENDYKSGYKKENEYRSDKISEPIAVDFVIGLIYITNRKYLFPIDHRDMKWTCYDLHLNGILKTKYPQVKRLIVPTNKWKQTEEEYDQFALNKHPDALKEKQELFERYFK